jgi:hypothetical protein
VLLQSIKQSLVIFTASLAYIDQSKTVVIQAIDALLVTKVDGLAPFRADKNPFEVPGITASPRSGLDAAAKKGRNFE